MGLLDVVMQGPPFKEKMAIKLAGCQWWNRTVSHRRLLIEKRFCVLMAAKDANRKHLETCHMRNRNFAIVLFCCLPLGCATIVEQGRMEEYGRVMDAYATAMRLSDFNTVCQYVDPSDVDRKDCLQRYDNMKIVGYDQLGVDIATDRRTVNQEVEVEYYFLDRYVAKTIRFSQAWGYRENRKSWLLRTLPPNFE